MVAKEGQAQGFQAVYKSAPSARHRGKRSDRFVSSACDTSERTFLQLGGHLESGREKRGVCGGGQAISTLSVSPQPQGPCIRLW